MFYFLGFAFRAQGELLYSHPTDLLETYWQNLQSFRVVKVTRGIGAERIDQFRKGSKDEFAKIPLEADLGERGEFIRWHIA